MKRDFDSMMREFRSGLQVDRNALDEDIEGHSGKYLRVQEEYVLECSLRDEAKSALDQQWAESSDAARRALTKSKEKFTEAQVKEWVAVHEPYLEAVSNYQEKDKQARLLGAMVAAYEMRGKMLRELAHLYVSGYFAVAAVRGATADTREADAELARKLMTASRRDRNLGDKPSLKKRR
jgi:hypothetical protein